MKSVLILTLIFVSAFSNTFKFEEQLLRDLFEQWKAHHGKVYSTSFEEETRFKIFVENYLQITEFNAEQDDVTLGLNLFADLNGAEFKNLYTGFVPKVNTNAGVAKLDVSDLPASVDWRAKGAVTPIKNQGQCGSCWAFSAVGALEGLHFINSTKLVSFSEQQLVDCVTADQGCDGGLPTDAFAYTAQAGGIETEADYPYTAQDGTCQFDKSKAYQVNTDYLNVTKGTDTVKAAVVGQPVSVGIQANQLIFQFYIRGVIKHFCGDNIDHGVLIVGYDTFSGTEAFIVKNSWGEVWGNHGYVYISTNGSANKGNGVCGILSMASIPVNQ